MRFVFTLHVTSLIVASGYASFLFGQTIPSHRSRDHHSTINVVTLPSKNNVGHNTSLSGEYQPDADTVLLLHFDEAGGSITYDASGYNNHGSGDVTVVPGKFGNARMFGGNEKSNNFSIGYHPSLDLGTGDFTYETWIKTTYDGSSHGIIDKGTFTPGVVVEIGIGNESHVVGSHAYFNITDDAGNFVSLNQQGILSDNRWHHFAGVRDGDYAILYVDGVMVDSHDISHFGQLDRECNMNIGGPDGTILDEVRISKKARTPLEFNIPTPPQNLTARKVGNSIVLQWDTPLKPIVQYKIFRDTTSPALTIFDNIDVSISQTTKFEDAYALPGKSYFYRITAVDSAGTESLFSNEANCSLQSVAALNVVPTSLDFGSVAVNAAAYRDITVFSTGNDTLYVTSMQSNNNVFDIIDKMAFDIRPSTSKNASVRFTPVEQGRQTGTLTIYHNGDQPPVTIELTGVGLTKTFKALPNPFTPNNDGYNDAVQFTVPITAVDQPEVFIFDVSGRKVAHLTIANNAGYIWNGNDEHGEQQPPGVYIYMVKVGGKIKHNGTITLIR
ncbi:gliding motility-associated C-terminal domain-containing protein [candidate division KSB1 bacterium]|nr:gliding motility-associated C-terminal domain-containing protein [candidate division KSB1 bacterium]